MGYLRKFGLRNLGFITVVLVLGALTLAQVTRAQGADVSIDSFTSLCDSVTVTFTINSNPDNDDLNLVVANATTRASIGFTDIPDIGTHTVTVAITAQPDQTPLLIDIGYGLTSIMNRVFTCGVVYAPSDGRVNPGYGDLEAVGYTEFDAQGNPSLVVYCWTGKAELTFEINAADVAVVGLPAQNVLVKESNQCRTAFYALASGQYQFMVWFDEGKVYTLIDDDLDFRDAYKTYYDPSE